MPIFKGKGMIAVESIDIDLGDYVYIATMPAGRKGHTYRVIDNNVLDVPSYQHKILVECVTGPDAGLKFTVTPANFLTRYERKDHGS